MEVNLVDLEVSRCQTAEIIKVSGGGKDEKPKTRKVKPKVGFEYLYCKMTNKGTRKQLFSRKPSQRHKGRVFTGSYWRFTLKVPGACQLLHQLQWVQ